MANIGVRGKRKLPKYYTDNTTREKIMNIKVKGNDRGESYKASVYERMNITQFASKSDYEMLVENNIRKGITERMKADGFSRKEIKQALPNAVKETIDKGWEFYIHRDKLIGTGQYEDFRYKDFKDKYIEQMKKWGIDSKYIDAINNANLQQLKEIFSKPNSKKDEIRKTELPALGFYYGSLSNSQREDVETSLAEALKFANIPEIDTDDAREVIQYARATVYVPTERGVASNARRRLRTADRPENDTYEELFNSMLSAYKQDRLNIHHTKTNNIYIPFVGSSRSGTKNATFMKMFETYAKGKGVNLG